MKYSDNHTKLKNVQRIRIQQVYSFLEVRNSTLSHENETIVKEELLDIFEGEKRMLAFESQQFPNLNPRQLTLYFDGQIVHGVIAKYSNGNWSCRTFNESAPTRTSFVFSESVNKPPSPPFTDVTAVQETLELEIIQGDKSCFKEKFPDSYRNIKEKLGDDCKKKIFVDIKQSIGNNTDEVPGIEIRETLIAGQVRYVELTSHVTDVLNPRFLVMLYDGVNIQAAINKISQYHPTMPYCSLFNNSAPNSWYPTFATNVTSQDPFAYIEDRLRVNFLDPMKPWGEEQDLECFDIQVPPCNRHNTTDDNRKFRIFVTYYIIKNYQTTTEEVEKFSVEVTEGRSEVVQIGSEFQSGNFENRTPRNLSLYLEDSVLHGGMGQLHSWSSGEAWSCNNSSAILDTGLQEVKTFMFLYDSRQKHFLSFSWIPSSSNGSDNCANIVLVFLLLIYTMLLQQGLKKE